MNDFFLISSMGHCATSWLHTVLTNQPSVVSSHAENFLNPLIPDVRVCEDSKDVGRIQPIMAYLKNATLSTNRQKIFGNIHGFRKLQVKRIAESEGGLSFIYSSSPDSLSSQPT
jgi:hypothetical protein